MTSQEHIDAGILDKADALRDEAKEAPPNPNRELIDGLRAMADFLEEHPQERCHSDLGLNFHPQTNAAFANCIRGIGKVDKLGKEFAAYYVVRKQFGGNVYIDSGTVQRMDRGNVYIDWNRAREQICTKVVKETIVRPAEPERTVTTVIPAKPERVEEITEWVCPDSLLGLAEETALRR